MFLETKLTNFLTFINDAKKQFLASDKFIQTLNEEGTHIIHIFFNIKHMKGLRLNIFSLKKGLESYSELFGKFVEINSSKEMINVRYAR